MNQDLCEKFWKGLGAVGSWGNYRLGDLRVSRLVVGAFVSYETMVGGKHRHIEVWLDPFDEDRVKLEVLIKGMLSRDMGACVGCYEHPETSNVEFTAFNDGNVPITDGRPTFRAAVIAAILKLLEEK